MGVAKKMKVFLCLLAHALSKANVAPDKPSDFLGTELGAFLANPWDTIFDSWSKTSHESPFKNVNGDWEEPVKTIHKRFHYQILDPSPEFDGKVYTLKRKRASDLFNTFVAEFGDNPNAHNLALI